MRRMLIALSLAVLFAMSTAARAEELSGVYSIASPQGPLALTLQEAGDGTVSGTLVGYDGTTYQVEGVAAVDEDGETFVEGTLSHPQARGHFTLTIDEDDEVVVSIVPVDAFGNPDHASTVVYAAVRGAPESAQAPAPAPASPAGSPPPQDVGVERDPRLVGVWSHQDIMSGSGMSVATQLVMQFHPDGTIVQGDARTMASGAWFGMDSGAGSGVEQGQWRTQGNVLYGSMAGSQWVAVAQYEVSADSLLLVFADGSRQLWRRQ